MLKNLALALSLACLLSTVGCTTFTTSIGPQVAKGVTRYCQEPQSERLVIREQVNGLIAPNTIKVTCAIDGNTDATVPR